MAFLTCSLKLYFIFYPNVVLKTLPISAPLKTLCIIITAFVSCSEWSDLLLIKKLMNLERLKLLLLLPLLWSYVFVGFSSTSYDITNFSIIKNTLYYHNWFCKLLRMTWSIVDRKTDKFRMSEVTAAVAVVMVICFRRVSVNISLNFICFIIENRLYYLDCAWKLLKTKLINLGYLEFLFLLPSPWLLMCSDLFPISFVRLLMALLLLLALNRFVCCSDGPDLLLIEKLINLGCLKLLLLVPLLSVTSSCSFCLLLRSSICVCCACIWVIQSVCLCCAYVWVVRSVPVYYANAWFVRSVCVCCACG